MLWLPSLSVNKAICIDKLKTQEAGFPYLLKMAAAAGPAIDSLFTTAITKAVVKPHREIRIAGGGGRSPIHWEMFMCHLQGTHVNSKVIIVWDQDNDTIVVTTIDGEEIFQLETDDRHTLEQCTYLRLLVNGTYIGTVDKERGQIYSLNENEPIEFTTYIDPKEIRNDLTTIYVRASDGSTILAEMIVASPHTLPTQFMDNSELTANAKALVACYAYATAKEYKRKDVYWYKPYPSDVPFRFADPPVERVGNVVTIRQSWLGDCDDFFIVPVAKMISDDINKYWYIIRTTQDPHRDLGLVELIRQQDHYSCIKVNCLHNPTRRLLQANNWQRGECPVYTGYNLIGFLDVEKYYVALKRNEPAFHISKRKFFLENIERTIVVRTADDHRSDVCRISLNLEFQLVRMKYLYQPMSPNEKLLLASLALGAVVRIHKLDKNPSPRINREGNLPSAPHYALPFQTRQALNDTEIALFQNLLPYFQLWVQCLRIVDFENIRYFVYILGTTCAGADHPLYFCYAHRKKTSIELYDFVTRKMVLYIEADNPKSSSPLKHVYVSDECVIGGVISRGNGADFYKTRQTPALVSSKAGQGNDPALMFNITSPSENAWFPDSVATISWNQGQERTEICITEKGAEITTKIRLICLALFHSFFHYKERGEAAVPTIPSGEDAGSAEDSEDPEDVDRAKAASRYISDYYGGSKGLNRELYPVFRDWEKLASLQRINITRTANTFIPIYELVDSQGHCDFTIKYYRFLSTVIHVISKESGLIVFATEHVAGTLTDAKLYEGCSGRKLGTHTLLSLKIVDKEGKKIERMTAELKDKVYITQREISQTYSILNAQHQEVCVVSCFSGFEKMNLDFKGQLDSVDKAMLISFAMSRGQDMAHLARRRRELE